MAQNFQMTEVSSSGVVNVLHPESNADQILVGLTYKVPTIVNIDDWIARSKELIDARKGKTTLKAKIDEIDKALEPAQLLASIKEVDGSGSGLDADYVDGKTVDDTSIANTSLWTAKKINDELGKKVNSIDIVKIATPNKLLLLNAEGKLVVDVVGNSNTSTSWKKATKVQLSGDVAGSFTMQGNETNTINLATEVKDDSHNHTAMTNGGNSIIVNTTDIAQFKKGSTILSKIDSTGNFTGSSNKVNNLSVNDSVNTGALWSNDKIIEELNELVKTIGKSTLDEVNGTIVLSDLITIKYGIVDISRKTKVDVVFSSPFKGKVLFDGYSIATSVSSFVCYKKIGSTTKTGITYDFNQAGTDGTLTWFAVGI